MKSYSTYLLIAGLFLLTLLAGYNYYFRPFSIIEQEKEIVVLPSPSPTLDLSKMSASQKVALIMAVPVSLDAVEPADSQDSNETKTLPATNSAQLSVPTNVIASKSAAVDVVPKEETVLSSYKAWVSVRQPGFGVAFGENINLSDWQSYIASIDESEFTYPVSWAVDHEGGEVQRFSGEGFTQLPSWQEVCDLGEVGRSTLYQQIMSELAVAQIDVVLGPVVDFGSNRILKDRICSDNNQLVIARAQEYISQAKEFGILPVIKHFPGIGKSSKDLHQQFQAIEINPEDAIIYQSLLEVNPNIGVMVSHIGVINQLPDVPCSLSSACVGQLISNYPDALRFTDALEMEAAGHSTDKERKLEERAVAAIKAGNDVLLFGQVPVIEIDRVFWRLVSAYESDPVISEKVDVAAKRIIEWKTQK